MRVGESVAYQGPLAKLGELPGLQDVLKCRTEQNIEYWQTFVEYWQIFLIIESWQTFLLSQEMNKWSNLLPRAVYPATLAQGIKCLILIGQSKRIFPGQKWSKAAKWTLRMLSFEPFNKATNIELSFSREIAFQELLMLQKKYTGAKWPK